MTRPFLTRSPERFEISTDLTSDPFYVAIYHRRMGSPPRMYVHVHEDLTSTLHWANSDSVPESEIEWESSRMFDIPGLLQCFEIREPVADRRYYFQLRYFDSDKYYWLRDQLRASL